MNRYKSSSYDQLQYHFATHPQTHPDSLFTVASLFGIEATDFRNCRVLEMGCAGGGNLLPLALDYPESRYLGIDISVEQIKVANAHKDALGLTNIEFIKMDLLEFPDDLGKFDYIICHGVFSWVNDPTRDKILEICHNHLSSTGLAQISYNTLPGWHSIRGIREMMRIHAKRFDDPIEKVKQARFLLKFLADNADINQPSYKAVLEDEMKMLAKADDAYLFHDHLEEDNKQYYFYQFVDKLHEHNLQYVRDIQLSSTNLGAMSEEVSKVLLASNDILMVEQYVDFLYNRRFRNSVITHSDIAIDRHILVERIYDLYITADIVVDDKAGADNSMITFRTRSGGIVYTPPNRDYVELLMTLISQQKKPIKIEELIEKTVANGNVEDEQVLHSFFQSYAVHFVMSGFLDVKADPGVSVTRVGDSPIAYGLTRYQAGIKMSNLTTAVRTSIKFGDFDRFLITYLDGKHDLTALGNEMEAHFDNGDISSDELEQFEAAGFENIVKHRLEYLACAGVLVA